MAENTYEGMFILDASRYSRDPSAASAQVEQLIQQAGGEVLASRLWEERRLAYAIKGHRKGVYWLTYFRVAGEQIQPLTRQCEINDLILRHLFISLHPKLADTIVSHALGQTGEGEGDDDGDAPADAEPAAVGGAP